MRIQAMAFSTILLLGAAGSDALACQASATCGEREAPVSCSGNVSCSATDGQGVTCTSTEYCGPGCTEVTTTTVNCGGGSGGRVKHQDPN